MSISAQGQDRSDFQAVFGWDGYDFGFAKATEALTWKAHTFAANWANLRKAGLPRGAYHFLRPQFDGASQGSFFYNYVKANGGWRDGDMAVCDTELFASNVDSCTKAFFDEVATLAAKDDVKLILLTYTNEDVGHHLFRTAIAYPLLWFAHPSKFAPTADQIAPFRDWKFWQWGIVRNIDRDAYNGSAADLKAWIKSVVAPPKVTVTILSDGQHSLLDYCQAHGNSPLRLIARTLLHGPHPRLVIYVAAHPALRARLPEGVRLYVRVARS